MIVTDFKTMDILDKTRVVKLGVATFFLILCVPASVTPQGDKRQPPSIELGAKLPDRYYKPQTVITLPCKATGIPEPTYTWIFQGAELGADPAIENLDFGNIRIRDAQRKHEGYYQCKATNTHGTSLSTVIHLQMAVLNSAGGTEVQSFTKSVGDYLKVSLRGLSGLPSPVFTWNTITSTSDPDPKKLPLSKRVLISKEGDLYFTHVVVGDANLLKLTAFNNYLDQSVGGSYSQVIINDGVPGDRAPVPVYPEGGDVNVIILEGEDLVLQCIFRGYPDIDVSWQSANDKPFTEDKNSARMEIKAVTRENEGTYMCTGTNTINSSPNYIEVDVQSRPKFADKPESVIMSEEEKAEFRCQATADTEPAATITWLFNGEPVNVDHPGPRISFTQENQVLTIIELNRETDIRVIQCNASNVHGYVFADAVLNVIARTKIVNAPESQTLFENTTLVKFECQVSSDPLFPATVTWLRDDRPVGEYNDPNLKTANNDRQLNILVDQAPVEERLNYAGRYACNASNGFTHQMGVAVLETYTDEGKTGAVVTAAFPFWLIIVLAVIGAILLLLILIFSCCIYAQRNKGDEYLVDDAERKQGNDPVKELDNLGFHDYQRPEEEAGPMMEKAPSMGSLNWASDAESLAEYGDDIMKFGEDGSFIGLYADEPRKKITVSQA